MNANELHERLKPLPEDFDAFVRNSFEGAWVGYVGTVYQDPQFLEDIPAEKMLYCTCCKTYSPTDIKISGKMAQRIAHCPECHEKLELYSLNKKKDGIERHETFWIGQNLGDGIFVLRGFRVTLRLYSPNTERDEDIIKQEIRRLYISPTEVYREYCGWGYDYATKKYICDEWGTRAAGFASASGPVYPSTYEEAKGTGAEYAHLKTAYEEGFFTDAENVSTRWSTSTVYYCGNDRDSIWDYLTLYADNRRVEMLVRLNMPYIIQRKQHGYATGLNGNAKNPWDYLKIYKSRLKGFQVTDGNEWNILCVYREERKRKLHFTDEEVKVISKMDFGNVGRCVQYMSFKQLLNRLNKYQKIHKMDKRTALMTYSDYLQMKADLGYDMTNSITVFPRDLVEEHNKAVEERNERAGQERARKMNAMFKGIAERFEKANKVYFYHSGKLTIRPAKDAAEIVTEGRLLHHCVGGETYLRKHENKQTIILFLRTDDTVPYITVEMDPSGKILQWYGAYDKKPDEAKISRWLGRYQKQLDKKALKREAKRKGA